MNTWTYMRPYYSYDNPLQWVQQGLSGLIPGFRNIYMGVTWLLSSRVDFPIINQFISVSHRKGKKHTIKTRIL